MWQAAFNGVFYKLVGDPDGLSITREPLARAGSIASLTGGDGSQRGEQKAANSTGGSLNSAPPVSAVNHLNEGIGSGLRN